MANVGKFETWSFLLIIAVTCHAQAALAQTPVVASAPKHLAYRSNQPPGAIGAMQIARGVAPAGYVQPVQVTVPGGASVEVAGADGGYAGQTDQLFVGLLVGQPYRFKVSNIPRHLSQAIYPSVELIGRLHPPEGEKNRFPVPIEFAQDDLELALEGNMIIRVVYLEHPERAFPAAEGAQQRSEDVLANEDPLQIADQIGRPVAIIRIGSRVPIDSDGDTAFRFDSPHVEWLTAPTKRANQFPPSPLAPLGDAYDERPSSPNPALPIDEGSSVPPPSPSGTLDDNNNDDLEPEAVAEPLSPPSLNDVEPPTDVEGKGLEGFDGELTEPDLPVDDPFLDDLFSE